MPEGQVSRECYIIPLLACPDQPLVHPVASTAHVQHLRKRPLGPVLICRLRWDERDITHTQCRNRILPDLDLQRSLEDLEGCRAGALPSRHGCLSLTGPIDENSRDGEVDVLRLRGHAQKLVDLINAVLAVEVLGTVVVGDEVRVAWGPRELDCFSCQVLAGAEPFTKSRRGVKSS